MPIGFRNVPWATGDYWRTDISANTLFGYEFTHARYALHDGPIVQVPMDDLRAALEHPPTRHGGNTVGPYNIYPFKNIIEVLQHQTKVCMEFGPFEDLEIDRLTTYQDAHTVPTTVRRPHVAAEHGRFADIILEHAASGKKTFERVKERLEDVNPTLCVRIRSDGTIAREEFAYCIRVNYLRAIRNSYQELLQ